MTDHSPSCPRRWVSRGWVCCFARSFPSTVLRVRGSGVGSGGRFVLGLFQLLPDQGVGVGEEGLGAVGVGVADGEVEAHGVGGREAAARFGGYAGAAGADYVALDGGYVVGVLEGGADFGLAEARLQLLGQADADPDYGLADVLAGDGFKDGAGRVVGCGRGYRRRW